MQQECSIIDNYLCIRMPKEIEQHHATHIRQRADELLVDEKVKNVVFDFENTTFMDSSGIGIIIGRYRKISCFGGKVYAIHADNYIKRMLMLAGINKLVEIR